jgi:hypothetical protein
MTQTDLVTARECAEYRQCSQRTLDREREHGHGCPYVRIGGRIYYRRCDVEQFIVDHICGGDRPPAIARDPALSSVAPPRHGDRPRKAVQRGLDQLTGTLPQKAAP